MYSNTINNIFIHNNRRKMYHLHKCRYCTCLYIHKKNKPGSHCCVFQCIHNDTVCVNKQIYIKIEQNSELQLILAINK